MKKLIQQAVETSLVTDCNFRGDPNTVRFNLLNYFLPKQHRFSSSLSPMRAEVVSMLGDTGYRLALLAAVLDTNVNHPDILSALGGAFKLESDFSQSINEFISLSHLFINMGSRGKNDFDYFMKTDKGIKKIYPRLNTANLVRFLKSNNDRNTIRQDKNAFTLKNEDLVVAWKRIQGTSLWGYVRFNTPTLKELNKADEYKHEQYFGFNRITMTNASAYLLKNQFNAVRAIPVIPSPTHSQWSWLPDHVRYVLEKVEVADLAIFDYFWMLTVGQDSILLGEREKRCYFLTIL